MALSAEARRGVSLGLRLALAHHPLCKRFRSDAFGRQWRICSGCAVAWPAFAAGLVLAMGLVSGGVPPLALAAGSAILGIPQGLSYVYRGGRGHRAAAKAVGGLGLAGLIVGLLWAPVGWSWKVGVLAALGLAFVALQAVRGVQMLAVCDACPWNRAWDHCPGFGTDVPDVL